MEQPVKTILLVEDDAANRKLVRVVLGDKCHYRILEAASAAEAMEQLRREKPDLLLLDIRLGEGSGLDVIDAVRADSTYDDVPAVAITAQAMKDDEQRFLAAGFDGYLSKPVDTRHLPEVVKRFINEGRKVTHA
ncbi:response regulator [Ferrigenium kumadai]|uniref:Response regulator n=2 Tax=Ferrigenium kumadai TaxID=1682490 RepID=A0AAN1W016_9PROT|nr:response regulator [Ferrigenium kumadai]